MAHAKPVTVLMKLISTDHQIRKTIKIKNASPTPQGVEFEIEDNDGLSYYCYIIPKKVVNECNIVFQDKPLMLSDVLKVWEKK